MKPIYLQSEDELYAYLKKFLATKPKAVQLDGSSQAKKSEAVILVFTYSINDRQYKLKGDTTRKAVEQFVGLADEHGSPAVVLKEYSQNGIQGLILATGSKPNGWRCELYFPKAADELKKSPSD